MSTVDLQINDDHPLALELTSLRTAISRYQQEAHSSSVKLQRHSLETSHALERAHILERENAILREELTVLRTHPDLSPHPASLQVNELTLSLRRLSDKLTYTEEILLTRTTELANALGEVTRAKHEVESAYELAAKGRAREEEGKARERELERRVKAAEEERRMTDLVVQEYADLVRSLEGRKSAVAGPQRRVASDDGSASIASAASGSSVTLVESLSEGKSGLQKLLAEFNGDIEKLEADIVRLHGELNVSQARLQAEQQSREEDRASLARARVELDKLKADDNSAAKVVSRYMKFSQSTTDNLQNALSNLKTRHASTLSSMDFDVQNLRKSLLDEKRQSERLRAALDELSEDISRETYGRRREVALRLALLSREETILEGLRRWSRRTQELLGRTALADPGQVGGAFEKILMSVAALLKSVEGTPSIEEDTPASVARILAAQDAVDTMVRELQVEMEKRLAAEKKALEAARPTHEGKSLVVPERAEKRGLSPSPPPPPPKHNYNAPQHLVKEPLNSTGGAHVTLDSPTTPKLTPLPSAVDVQIPQHDDDTVTPLSLAADHVPRTTSDTGILVEQDPGLPDSISEAQTIASSSSISNQSSTLLQTPPSVQDIPSLSSSDDLLRFKGPEVVLANGSSLLFPTSSESVVFPSSDSEEIILAEISEKPAPVPVSVAVVTSSSESEKEQVFDFPSPASKHSALSELLKVKDRYDDLQRAFRECHQALKELKTTLSSASVMTASSSSSSLPVLQTALERLDDCNEDIRVELEIRVADEERVIRGYETLLTVQSAITDQDERDAIEHDIQGFLEDGKVSGTKDREQFSKKLEDLQHDIAVLKKVTHELELVTTPPDSGSSPKKLPGWSSWTSGLLSNTSHSRPSNPAPTFGSVMTTPRLRHTSSYGHMHVNASTPNVTGNDPFASLGLRIPMPSHVLSSSSGVPGNSIVLGQPPPTRARTTSGLSALYALGLGSRSSSMALPVGQHQRKTSAGRFDNPIRENNGTLGDYESEAETEDSDSDGQIDIE